MAVSVRTRARRASRVSWCPGRSQSTPAAAHSARASRSGSRCPSQRPIVRGPRPCSVRSSSSARLPGQPVRHEASAAVIEPRVDEVAADVQHRRARQAEVRAQRRPREGDQPAARGRSNLEGGGGRKAAEPAEHMVARQRERDEPGEDPRREAVPESADERVSATVGAGLGQAAAARGHDDAAGLERVGRRRVSRKPSRSVLEARHAPGMADLHPGLARRPQQRVQDRPRAVRGREQLARLFLLQGDAQVTEEGHGLGHAEAPEDLADGLGGGAGESGLVHLVVGHVAARAARDEDLGPERARPVEEQDAAFRLGAPRLNGGHEPGRPRAHHRHVHALGHAGIGPAGTSGWYRPSSASRARCIMAFPRARSPHAPRRPLRSHPGREREGPGGRAAGHQEGHGRQAREAHRARPPASGSRSCACRSCSTGRTSARSRRRSGTT